MTQWRRLLRVNPVPAAALRLRRSAYRAVVRLGTTGFISADPTPGDVLDRERRQTLGAFSPGLIEAGQIEAGQIDTELADRHIARL